MDWYIVCIGVGCHIEVCIHLHFMQVRDKFHLELSEEEAIRVLQNLIDDSVNAIFAVLLERAHKMAQASVVCHPTVHISCTYHGHGRSCNRCHSLIL